MSLNEGYIKFHSDWMPGPAPDADTADLLNRWRRPLYERGLIGYDATQNVGYGNISMRAGDRRFVISGTQTGHVARPGSEHYVLVTAFDIAGNCVVATGPVQPSSESLTHAAIYELDPAIGAVVHVHSRRLWKRFISRVPTTAAAVAYGTPEMAREFGRLYRDTNFADCGIAVMAGHEHGIVSIGSGLEIAARRVLDIADEP